MRVCEIGNYLDLPAPDGPHHHHHPARLSAKSLAFGLASPRFPPVPKLLEGNPMSSDGRSRRRELVEEAYQLQVKAGLMARHIPLTEPTR